MADVFNIPLSIEAGTADELSRLMLSNNLKNQKWFNYQIVVKGGKFYAWYFNDLDQEQRLREEIKKIKKPDGDKK